MNETALHIFKHKHIKNNKELAYYTSYETIILKILLIVIILKLMM